ncbi:hypothetical protein LCGC14_0924420 [marine sediment metagenome]|uniref:Uncharacterized protein n=1 Tax=marine sediment metagenome TaxID=412755 RepID=A0A0F9NPV1_9ZZZZ
MAKFITHFNNKHALINLDLIENIYAQRDGAPPLPIKDSDGLFTLILDPPWYINEEIETKVEYIEKFKSVEELEARLNFFRSQS